MPPACSDAAEARCLRLVPPATANRCTLLCLPPAPQVYMTYVQATQGGGGWPMSCFLTPRQAPHFAACAVLPARPCPALPVALQDGRSVCAGLPSQRIPHTPRLLTPAPVRCPSAAWSPSLEVRLPLAGCAALHAPPLPAAAAAGCCCCRVFCPSAAAGAASPSKQAPCPPPPGTYFPPSDSFGRPGFKTVLRRIAQARGAGPCCSSAGRRATPEPHAGRPCISVPLLPVPSA